MNSATCSMSYPKWVPPVILEELNHYNNRSQAQALSVEDQQITEMWNRLATRPEMEVVWRFISQFEDSTISLVANGGLLGTINRGIRQYHHSPKLSPTDYKDEMTEIAKMAAALSSKLKKFTAADVVYRNPFPVHALLDDEQIAHAKCMMRPDIFTQNRDMIGHGLDTYLPSIDEQLLVLSAVAKNESVHQFCRLPLPRKVNDKNTLRTYFARIVADLFFITYADYSPSRIAIFCSVALDDPDITPDLIRKLFPLDPDCKELLRLNTENRHRKISA